MIRQKAEPRPEGIGTHEWKNRTRVGAKLTSINYSTFVRWCKTKNFNFNSGINYLIHTHPELKENG